ncbi:succinate dehydrogenase assembly factor 2, partial [Candidatus Erwinia haradaeae]
MDIKNKSHVRLACCRGMRELNILIEPFLQNEFESLSIQDKSLFILLLK